MSLIDLKSHAIINMLLPCLHSSGFRQPLQLLDTMATCGCAADLISTWEFMET